MLTKIKLALAISGSLLAGAAGLAAAHGDHGGDKGAMLKKYDANGDGKLDDTERAKMRADFEAKRAEHKQEMLAKFDTNKDGKLDDAERKVMKDARAAEAFKKMDLDGNGSISLDEFKQAKGKFGDHHRGGHGMRDRGEP